MVGMKKLSWRQAVRDRDLLKIGPPMGTRSLSAEMMERAHRERSGRLYKLHYLNRIPERLALPRRRSRRGGRRGSTLDLQKIGCQATRKVKSVLPLRELFLEEFSNLEKILVLINVVLFAASLSDENIDQDVGAAIMYIMFAMAYFVTTTMCLSGAQAIKKRTSLSVEANANDDPQSTDKKTGLTI